MNQIVVIKCGGSTVESLDNAFFQGMLDLIQLGKQPILVHGGGPAIKAALATYNIESEFVNGLRKTTSAVMDIVEMVLAGKINKWLVNKLQMAGVNAVGLSGIDGGLLRATAVNQAELGFVGEVSMVNQEVLHMLLERKIVPVIAPIGMGENGERFNINADSAAGAIAVQMQAEQLLFVTDVPGILQENKLLEQVTVNEVRKLILNGTIYGGMIPKVEAALHALTGKLTEVMITSGKQMVINGKVSGTTIIKEAIHQ